MSQERLLGDGKGSRLPVVLYLHGFEENKSSPKPVSLAPHVDLRVPHLGVYLTHWNSPIRYALTSWWFFGCLATGGAIGAGAWLAGAGTLGGSLGGAFVAACALALTRKRVLAAGIRGALLASYAIARSELKRVRPDALVGFSWGGCLATMLVRDGHWSGPTLLLAPAFELLLSKSRLSTDIGALKENSDGATLIVHSLEDQIVPIGDSRRLAASARVALHEVRGERHAMFGLAKDEKLYGLFRRVMDGRAGSEVKQNLGSSPGESGVIPRDVVSIGESATPSAESHGALGSNL